MNTTDLIFQILQIALGIAQQQTAGSGPVEKDLDIANSLIQIARATKQAYEQHMGEPMDLSLIKAEDPL